MHVNSVKVKRLALLICILSLTLLAVPVLAVDSLTLFVPNVGSVNVIKVSTEAFDRSDAWENYSNADGAKLDVENGSYRAYTPDSGYVWGLNKYEQTNVVAEVQVTPLTIYTDIGEGIMCRADESDNGDGYYFMINVNGYYSIRMAHGDDVTSLIDWKRSKAIHTGIDQNTIRAVCVGDYLAMYVNGTLVGSVTDNTFSSGYTGLTVAGGMNGADASFDNLVLYNTQPR